MYLNALYWVFSEMPHVCTKLIHPEGLLLLNLPDAIYVAKIYVTDIPCKKKNALVTGWSFLRIDW